MEIVRNCRIPIVFLWGSSMAYIFVSSYYENEKKKKLISENKILNESYDKFKDPNYNPFKPYRP